MPLSGDIEGGEFPGGGGWRCSPGPPGSSASSPDCWTPSLSPAALAYIFKVVNFTNSIFSDIRSLSSISLHIDQFTNKSHILVLPVHMCKNKFFNP